MSLRIIATGWYWWALALCILAGAWWTPHLAHETACLFVRVMPAHPPGQDKLLKCSNIEQSVMLPTDGSIQDRGTDVSGWRMFTPAGDTGRLRISIAKSADEMIFYPRFHGQDSSVTVYEVQGGQRRLLQSLHGTDKGWSPIGRRMVVMAGCVANGWSEEEFPMEVELVFAGKEVQVWHKDGIVFFGR